MSTKSNPWVMSLVFGLVLGIAYPIIPAAWANGEEALSLPRELTGHPSEMGILKLLLKVKQSLPELVANSAYFSYSLADRVEDQIELQKTLLSRPGYRQAFKDKKYYDITITQQVNSPALTDFKIKMKEALLPFLKSTSEPILTQISKDFESRQDGISANPKNLIRQLFSDFEKASPKNGEVFKKVIYSNKKLTTEERLTLFNQSLNQFQLPDGFDKSRVQSIFSAMTNQDKVKNLFKLYTLLQHHHGENSKISAESAQKAIEQTNDLDLQQFQNKDLFIKSYREIKKSPDSKALAPVEDTWLKEIHKDFDYSARGQAFKNGGAPKTFTLEEMPPWYGIFRGVAGNDCSTESAFASPNSPLERIFFIHDQNQKIVGYLQGSELKASGIPSFFVSSIEGKYLTTEDTEVILRGLISSLSALNAQQIVIPEPDRLNVLVNFEAIRAAFAHIAATDQPSVKLDYQDQEFRSVIENFHPRDSESNNSTYEHMRENKRAQKLNPAKGGQDVSVISKAVEKNITSLQLDNIRPAHFLEFILEMNTYGQEEELTPILADAKNLPFSAQELNKLLHLIKEGIAESTTETFRQAVEKEIAAILPKENDPATAFPMKDIFLYPGILKCQDAFAEARIEKTSQIISDVLLGRGLELNTKEADLVRPHIEALKTKKGFLKVIKKADQELQDFDTDLDPEWVGGAQEILASMNSLNLELSPLSYAKFFNYVMNYRPHSVSGITLRRETRHLIENGVGPAKIKKAVQSLLLSNHPEQAKQAREMCKHLTFGAKILSELEH
jgi:hypothetical protein